MGEYEPDDSRNITRGTPHNPIEPERTGPREGIAREEARDGAKDKAERDRFAAVRDGEFDEEQPADPVRGRPDT